jgi:hypothetical protein
VDNETLLREIGGYCRRVGMAESTFGRLSVNDGKLVSRLRLGGRVTLETVDRVHGFIDSSIARTTSFCSIRYDRAAARRAPTTIW